MCLLNNSKLSTFLLVVLFLSCVLASRFLQISENGRRFVLVVYDLTYMVSLLCRLCDIL